MPDLTLDDLGQVAPAAVVTLHNNMIKALRSAYPKWQDWWHISINTEGGMVQVRNLAISGKMGIQMRIVDVHSQAGLKDLVNYAGELFERYNIARKKGLDIRQALADLKGDATGAYYET